MTQHYTDKDANTVIQIDINPDHAKEMWEYAYAGTYLQFNGTLVMYLMAISNMIQGDVQLKSSSDGYVHLEVRQKQGDSMRLYNCFTPKDAFSKIECYYDMAKATAKSIEAMTE